MRFVLFIYFPLFGPGTIVTRTYGRGHGVRRQMMHTSQSILDCCGTHLLDAETLLRALPLAAVAVVAAYPAVPPHPPDYPLLPLRHTVINLSHQESHHLSPPHLLLQSITRRTEEEGGW